jgi:starch synthase
MGLLLSSLLSLALPIQAQNAARAVRPVVAPVLGAAPVVGAPKLAVPAAPSLPAPKAPAGWAHERLALPEGVGGGAAAPAMAVPAAAAAVTNAILPSGRAHERLALPEGVGGGRAAAVEVKPTEAADPRRAATLPSNEGAGANKFRTKKLEILMAGAESHPFVKTGGLADVVDDLGRGLAARGHRVTLILPKFASVDPDKFRLERVPGSFLVPMGDRVEVARLWKTERADLEVYFLDNPNMYSRPGPYGYDGYDGYGKRDYPDNDERFLFHARGALEAMRFLGREPDIVHAHDWHVGLLPALLKTAYAQDPFFAAARSVATIHNIAYQGLFPWSVLGKTGVGKDGERPAAYERHGMFSYLKAALVHADAVTTVSPTYAEEVKTAQYGEGMEALLRERAADLVGILNGIDLSENDPARDPVLARNYSAADRTEGKAANKAELQGRLGLDADPAAPVYAVASRFAHQKGIDLVIEAADAVLKAGGQLVLTGSGDKELEEAAEALAAAHPGRVARHPFDTVFVKLVYAAADFLLMPSRFEPCGLSQLIAQRYGTLPIATKTGGLADTIVDQSAHPSRGDGFHAAEFSADALREAVARAAALFADRPALDAARLRAMEKDSSWAASIDRYLELYRRLLSR